MIKKILIIAFFTVVWGAKAQVGIGTLRPNPSAMLDVVGNKKGVLIPRVTLQSYTDTTTVLGSVNGTYENSLLVFNIQKNEVLTPGYYYWYENKWNRIINQEDLLHLDTNTKNSSLTVINQELVVTDTEGQTVSLPISEFNIVTTLVNHQNGNYTYTSENGTITTINVTSDVQNQFLEIVSHPNVKNILEEVIKATSDMVKFDGDHFTYIDSQGQQQTIDLPQMIDAYQKKVTLIDGNYTNVQQSQDVNNPNNTIWKVDVDVAKGTTNGTASSYGVVRENTNNPTVSISQSGELMVNMENVNRVKYINNNYSVALEDAILLGDASTSNINITLPNATQNKGKRLIIKKEDNNENYYVTVLGNIFGAPNELYTALPYSGWEFVSDGAQWKIINKF